MKIQDRRRNERFEILIEGTFGADGRVFNEFLQNISLGGMCINSPINIELNTILNIIIPSRPPFKVKGKVIWTKKDGLSYKLGIQFITRSEEQNAAIRQLISSFFWEKQSHIC